MDNPWWDGNMLSPWGPPWPWPAHVNWGPPWVHPNDINPENMFDSRVGRVKVSLILSSAECTTRVQKHAC